MAQQDRTADRRTSLPEDASGDGEPPLPPGCHCRVFVGRDEPELLSRVTRMRADVWKEILPAEEVARNFPDGHWREAIDDGSYQWAVLNDADELVATTRLTLAQRFEDLPNAQWWAGPTGETLVPVPGPVAWLARKVVLAAYQGSGLATFLMPDQLRWARHLGARSVLVQARGPYTEVLLAEGYQRLCPARPGIFFPSCEFTCFLLVLEDAEPAMAAEP
jgi:GNAT superfamily N-acetyltransferase